MKNLLKILLISSLSACSNNSENNANTASKADSVAARDSAMNDLQYNNNDNTQNFPDPSGIEASEKEITRQITSALIFSKTEIGHLRTEISDSLSKSGLPGERRSFFVRTIRQLETSTELINKELENIMVADLKKNHDKLCGIVKNMKASEKELGNMIARLDRINGYIQLASSLIQTLVPPIPFPAKKQHEK